jgi:predicted DNA binding CopG/RHH family protein
MKKKTVKYTDDKGEIAGDLRRVADHLPSPAELAGVATQTKITLALDQESLEFFRREARRHNTSYQRMIRNLVRAYARAHS